MAICVLALILVLLFTLYPMTGLSVDESRHSLQAQTLADSMLDQLRTQSVSTLPIGAADWPPVVRNGVTFNRHLEVFAVPGRDENYLKAVEVHISWSARGRTRELVRELWLSSVGK